MGPKTGALLLLLAAGGIAAWAFFGGHKEDTDDIWESAYRDEDSLTGRVLLSVARPLGRTRGLETLSRSPELSWLQRKILAAGSPYGGSVDVFIAVEAAALIIGVLIAIIGIATPLPTLIFTGIGLSLALIPYARLSDAATKRTRTIVYDMPDFVDLLLIPIIAGVGIKLSLQQTAERFSGPVAIEVRNAILLVDAGLPLRDALAVTAHRLAVPEAKVFFTSLAQSESQGTPVTELMERQRDLLRAESFQRQREIIKAIPAKLIVVFAFHLLPVLFSLAIIPLLSQLAAFLAQ